MKPCFLFSLLYLLLLTTCSRPAADEWKPTDLLQYGLPLTVLAPDSLQANKRDWAEGQVQDVRLQQGTAFDLQIYAVNLETNDISKIKARQIAEVKSNRFFSRIVREEEAGFIYETQQDSSNLNYGFRFVFLQGDKEYILQNGVSSLLSLEQAERLYEAAKPR